MTRIFAAQLLSLLALMFVGCTPGTPVESPTGDDDPVADDDGNGDDDTVEYGSVVINAPLENVEVNLTPTDGARDMVSCETVCELASVAVGTYNVHFDLENAMFCESEVEIVEGSNESINAIGGYALQGTFEACLEEDQSECFGEFEVETADFGDYIRTAVTGIGAFKVNGDQLTEDVENPDVQGTISSDVSEFNFTDTDGVDIFFFKL